MGAFALAMVALAFLDPIAFDLVVSTFADAFLGVAVFVAITLAGFYGMERRHKARVLASIDRHSVSEIPLAALLGALPGCGGAIIVVTRFVSGSASFGALVAVLVATMGDAAFLLLAREPKTAVFVYGLSLLCGVLMGFVVNAAHRVPPRSNAAAARRPSQPEVGTVPQSLTTLFTVLLVPGLILGIAGALQLEANAWFGEFGKYDPVKYFGFAGTLLCIVIWLSQPLDSWTARFLNCSSNRSVQELFVAETSFVSVWVALGFLSFELLVYFTHLDLGVLFRSFGWLSVVIAALIGLVPGCGPQIIVTTLYLNGVAPLSAQVANAISNDGDALFPALALAPKAALYATLYSTVPALCIGGILYWMGY
ncbi:MAG: putative manganese transporter [Pseudomonadota bacterium]